VADDQNFSLLPVFRGVHLPLAPEAAGSERATLHGAAKVT